LSGSELREMYSVFNMGHRLEIYLPEKYADEIISISKSYNIDAQIIGYCARSDKTRLTIKSGEHIIEY
jgi:phosphoribosylformylglycinamidine cyclo-ligase